MVIPDIQRKKRNFISLASDEGNNKLSLCEEPDIENLELKQPKQRDSQKIEFDIILKIKEFI